MATVVILIGTGDSGKMRTINKIGDLLGLTPYKTRNKGLYPSFITWAGEAQEVFMKTSSIQEDAMSRNREVFAQTSSLQEKNRAILSRIMEEANVWIRFLGERPNSVAIIPFTLTGGEDLMEDLILKPLELFQRSGNHVRTV